MSSRVLAERRVLAAASPPVTVAELCDRADALAGRTLGELAALLGETPPETLHRAKGYAGGLVERLLGASAGSRAEPDFVGLGVELKTLPVTAGGKPLESTFVCSVDLFEMGRTEWFESRVRAKLAQVLWVPIEGSRELPPAVRRVGQPLLWTPSANQEAALRFDWEELGGLLSRGAFDEVTAHLGSCLQVRPKAAHGRVRRAGVDADGNRYSTLPRGFYLRARFTHALLREHYAL